jgi:hypothetical protein
MDFAHTGILRETGKRRKRPSRQTAGERAESGDRKEGSGFRVQEEGVRGQGTGREEGSGFRKRRLQAIDVRRRRISFRIEKWRKQSRKDWHYTPTPNQSHGPQSVGVGSKS